MPVERQRRVTTRSVDPARRLVIGGLRAGRRLVPMIGLVELDVTDAKRMLRDHPGGRLSMTAFIVASVARAAQTNPDVHGYRDWRGRVVTHDFVDVGVIVEVATPQGPRGFPHLLRDADIRDVADLTAELRRVEQEPYAGSAARLLERFGPLMAHTPGAVRGMYAAMARSTRLRRQVVGTVSVTSVGMFAGGGGYGISPPTVAALEIVVGGMARRPLEVGGRIEVRDVLDLTIQVDHTVVDGAPASRFSAEFRGLVERASVLRP